MPVSKHKPPMSEIREYYKKRGGTVQETTVASAIKQEKKTKSDKMKARKKAMENIMTGKNLCKSRGKRKS